MELVVGHKRSRVSEPPIAPVAIGCGGDEGEDEDQLQHQPEAKRLLLQAPAWASSTPTPQNPQHPASRIYRVSRASGGKDRHSKVYTAKGIRDRRVRLSVATAIQFYDLQDRLGLDQPSKAIDWLITAAANAIDALPDLPDAAAFPSHPASAKPPVVVADDNAKSACSSTSDTSKGSVLSLSRSDSRLKARQRARHRSIKDKDDFPQAPTATAAAAAASSFTEMLTGMVADQKQQQQQQVQHAWQPTATADYIGFAQQPRKMHAMAAPGFASPAPHLGNHVTPIAMAPAHHFSLTPAAASAVATEQHTHPHPHAEMTTHFSFLQQDHHHFIHTSPPATATAAADYNLSFSMSSGLVGVNNTRGTLQSNSHHHLSAHHHLHHPPSLPFLFTPSAPAAAPDNHFATATAALQLWDVGFRHAADIKEKSKH